MSVATVVRRMASSAIITGALLASSAVAAHAQPTSLGFFSAGGNVSVKYVFTSAADNDQLYYKIGNVFDSNLSNYTLLFTNNSPASPLNTIVNIGNVAAGTEVVFALRNMTQSYTFFTGPTARNAGDPAAMHVSIIPGASNTIAPGGGTFNIKFGFEDRQPLVGGSDADYNDIQFEIANAVQTVAPEPSSYVLMASGLLALGVAARRRRKV
ncbi:MAG: PEP-CTERM sorting domain-containing protein [Gemmatimonas sp.]